MNSKTILLMIKFIKIFKDIFQAIKCAIYALANLFNYISPLRVTQKQVALPPTSLLKGCLYRPFRLARCVH